MSDTFRKVYRPLHESNSSLIVKLKEAFESVESVMRSVPEIREMAIAIAELESASMWATKSIVLLDELFENQPIDNTAIVINDPNHKGKAILIKSEA